MLRSVRTAEQTQRRLYCTCRTTSGCPWSCKGICL